MHKDEIINRVLILVLGVLSGSIVYLLRTEAPTVQPLEWMQFQYLLMFILLGMLPMLRLRANSAAGRALTEFLTIVILVIAIFQPIDILLNGLIALTVFLGSIAYFRFYYGSLGAFVLSAGVLLVELFGYGVISLWFLYQETGDFRFLFGMAMLAVIFVAVMRMLYKEYTKSSASDVMAKVRSLIPFSP